MLRWRLVVEAGQSAARFDPERRRNDQRLKFRRGGQVAQVALARRLAVSRYGMLRQAGFRAPEATAEARNVNPAVRMSGSSAQTVVEATPSTRGLSPWPPGLRPGDRRENQGRVNNPSDRWRVEWLHRRIQRGEPWSGSSFQESWRTKPWKKHPALCPIPVSGVQSRPQGSAMNGPAEKQKRRTALDPAPARGSGSLSKSA